MSARGKVVLMWSERNEWTSYRMSIDLDESLNEYCPQVGLQISWIFLHQ